LTDKKDLCCKPRIVENGPAALAGELHWRQFRGDSKRRKNVTSSGGGELTELIPVIQ